MLSELWPVHIFGLKAYYICGVEQNVDQDFLSGYFGHLSCFSKKHQTTWRAHEIQLTEQMSPFMNQ